MKVNDNTSQLWIETGKDLVGLSERAIQVVHKYAPREVHDGDRDPPRSLNRSQTDAWYVWRVVRWPEDSGGVGKEFKGFLFVPDVVARCKDMDPGRQEIFRCVGSDTEPAGSILSVGGHQVDIVIIHQAVQEVPDCDAPRLTHHVADKKNLHGFRLFFAHHF